MIASVQHISTLDHQELEPYRTLRRPIEHLSQGIFVAEGEKVILRLLESGLPVRSLLLSRDWFDIHQRRIEENQNGINVFIGEKKLLESIVGHVLHQSIMGLGSVPDPLRPEDIIADYGIDSPPAKAGRTFVLVDGITNAENMGVIVRNCVCFAVDALLVLPTSCDPYLRRSVRNSMGNIFQLPIAYIRKPTDELRMMKERGVRLYAAHPHGSGPDIRTVKVSPYSCIVLGAEGHGISQDVLDLCDEWITIPMKEGVDSLNVASASAVILWEMQQHRSSTSP